MFFAINSKTNEKVNSLTIETNPSYQFIEEDIWYADPDEIESYDLKILKENQIEDVTKIPVAFRRGHLDIINFLGTKYSVSPHFFIPNKARLGINTIPESKEHKLAKNWIYNKLQSANIIISYCQINKPYKYTEDINLFDLDLDKDKIGIEVSASTFGNKLYRRADIICPFQKKHELLGKGIVFEIQFSEQYEKTKISRELDWAIRGFSIAWLYKEDFNFISETIIDLKTNKINVDSFANLIKQNNKSFIKNLKFTVQDSCREFDLKKEEVTTELFLMLEKVRQEIHKEKTKQVSFDIEGLKDIISNEFERLKSNIQPYCRRCNTNFILKRRRADGGKFWICPDCGVISSYDD
jgi:hypothetical protein